MEKTVRLYIIIFIFCSGIFFCISALVIQLSSMGSLFPFSLAFVLSLAFTGSNFWNVRNVNMTDHALFARRFYRNIAARFLLVLGALILVLLAIGKHQIFFIISFMFSYLCLSLFEIISIKKILEINRKR
jgi:hypothetical protein